MQRRLGFCALFSVLLAAPAAQDQPLFKKLAPQATGLTFESRLRADHKHRRLYHSGFSAAGIAIGDLDGDGRPDVFFGAGPELNRLYRQTTPWKFADVTAQAGAGLDGGDKWAAGVAFADVDNDGDLDIYVCNYDAPNELFVNDGKGHFVERGKAMGVDLIAASFMPSFCDYDRDGDLDLFVLTYRAYRPGGRPKDTVRFRDDGTFYVVEGEEKYYRGIPLGKTKAGKPVVKVKTYGHRDHLFRNDGDGTFTDVSKSAGIDKFGLGLSATWWDYDVDGWPDLYVCNDFDDPDYLFHNNRDGTFTNVIASVVPHTTWFSMGSDQGDLNNDGLIDFIAADMSATNHFKQKTTMGAMNAKAILAVAGPPPQMMRNAVFLNTGIGKVQEAAFLMGIADTDWTWGVRIADFDSDGWNDVFFANGMTRTFNDSDIPFAESLLDGREQFDIYKKAPSRKEQNLMFRNTHDLGFADVSRAWGLAHTGLSFGAATGDLDGDGDLDLLVGNLDEPVSVYRNDGRRHNITFRLKGSQSNRFGIGARVELVTTRGRQVRQLFPAGLLASHQPIVHFGLGDLDRVQRVEVSWPNGTTQLIEAPAVDRQHVVTETGSKPTSASAEPLAWFRRTRTFDHVVHRENRFDDFKLQPLLPNKLSDLGPGLALGDIDGDGDEDAFVGGGAGTPGQLLRNDAGRFSSVECFHLLSDKGREDMGAVFFDVDADGDLDLYVASGGVAMPNGVPLLSDRVYLNDGKGEFVRAGHSMLPRSTDRSSVVAACDYDRDGDVDVFVGSRLIRGRYPLAPRSRLLQNGGGTFRDVTKASAAGLVEVGLVTSALWSDVDGDGWTDLLVALEWGPIKLFKNQSGKLVDATKAAGLADLTGWWNGLAGRDLDGDGDIDYVATNFGLNSKYHASRKKPALLYYGDFEKNGRMHLVEAEYEGSRLFPIRGKSCSSGAMPFLRKKFPTYKSFALAELDDLYTDQCIEGAHRFAATTLESGLLRNDGKGGFTFEKLPRLAQIAPGFGVVITEVNGDTRPDVVIAQNFYGPQLETGRMDGGLGVLLVGRPDGGFDTLWPAASGLVIDGDATALATTDLDGDGRLDLVVARNQASVQGYRATFSRKPVLVRLRGPKGNPTGIGARVTVRLADGRTQTAEIHAGGSYLGQSAPLLAFGRNGSEVSGITVRWPDGGTTQHAATASTTYELSR